MIYFGGVLCDFSYVKRVPWLKKAGKHCCNNILETVTKRDINKLDFNYVKTSVLLVLFSLFQSGKNYEQIQA